jgi:hypothetical protein
LSADLFTSDSEEELEEFVPAAQPFPPLTPDDCVASTSGISKTRGSFFHFLSTMFS